jgi:squalene-hopene/tetraprenyl-beta-curcumene cyclase
MLPIIDLDDKYEQKRRNEDVASIILQRSMVYMNRTGRSFTIGVALILVFSGLAILCGSVSAENVVTNDLLDAKLARDRGLEWLRSSQLDDGSWSYDLGITSLCVLTFLNAGYDETDDTVSNAVDYIMAYVQPDGSISSGTYANYYTSAALLTLASTHNSDYDIIIKNAAQFIMDIQIDESTPDDAYSVTESDWRYGGIGYGGDGRPDMSNTQFALMALHAAESSVDSVSIPDEVWENALIFIQRCHNNIEFNDQDWASDTSRTSFNDGGYIYFPTNDGSLAGGTDSYMSMTGAGIWSALLCGVDVTDGRVYSALKWVSDRYTWEENVGFEYKALYYNYWTMARALTIGQIKEIRTTDGISHNWFEELSSKLISLQTEEGYWANTESDWFWENIPDIATSYALLALETNLIDEASQIEIRLKTGTRSAADVKVYDGENVKMGEKITVDGDHIIVIPDVDAETIQIEVVGKTDSSYTLEVLGKSNDREVAKRTYTGTISEGEHKEVELVVTAVEGPLSLFGGDELGTTEIESSSQSIPNQFLLPVAILVLVIVGLAFIMKMKRKMKKGSNQ